MFLTASEIRYFQNFGNAAIEASALSVAATISYSLIAWRVSRPYLQRAWVALVWACAFTVALGMVARDAWEKYRPQVMEKIDAIVESGYAVNSPVDKLLESPDRPMPSALPVAAKAIKPNVIAVKRGIRELRLEAKAKGIKGFARMTLAQLAEQGITP